MKTNKTKITSFLLATIMCITLAGCNTKAGVEQTNETLTVYTTRYQYSEPIVAKFRGTYSDVDLKFVTPPTDADEREAFFKKLNADIMAGKGPDLIWMDSRYFLDADVDKMIASGAFADIEPFIQADAAQLSGNTEKDTAAKLFNYDDYNENAMQLGMVGEKRYIMPLMYDIPVYMTTESIVKETGFDPAQCTDFYAYIDQLNQAGDRSGINPVNSGVSRGALGNFYQTLGINVLDTQAKTLNLDAPEFKRGADAIKSLCDRATWEQEGYIGGLEVDYLRDKQTIVASRFTGSFGMLFENMMKLDQYGEKAIMVPMRDANGKIHGMLSESCAILATSPNQQNAFNFIKIALSNETQVGNEIIWNAPYSVPVRNEAIDIGLKRFQQEWDINYSDSLGHVLLKGITDEQVAQYKGFVADVVDVQIRSRAHSGIGYAMQSYYTGKQSFDETLTAVKNTMEIYISE